MVSHCNNCCLFIIKKFIFYASAPLIHTTIITINTACILKEFFIVLVEESLVKIFEKKDLLLEVQKAIVISSSYCI